jgi:hypothetical protein
MEATIHIARKKLADGGPNDKVLGPWFIAYAVSGCFCSALTLRGWGFPSST